MSKHNKDELRKKLISSSIYQSSMIDGHRIKRRSKRGVIITLIVSFILITTLVLKVVNLLG